MQINHYSSPAGEIYLHKFALINRLQDIPCVTHCKFLLDLHPLNFLKPCNVLIFPIFLSRPDRPPQHTKHHFDYTCLYFSILFPSNLNKIDHFFTFYNYIYSFFIFPHLESLYLSTRRNRHFTYYVYDMFLLCV